MKTTSILLFILCSFFISNNAKSQDSPALFASALDYCPGDPGVTFGVENSEDGETYRLQRFNEQTNQWQNIRIVTGNGGTVLFGGQHQAGNYRLQQDIENEIEITEKSLPQIFEVTGGGGYCDNTTDYPVIGLSNSQPFAANVLYELYLDDNFVTTQPGIGNAFNFANPDPDIIGFPDPGIYTVLAILDGCEAEMDGEVEVIVFPAPSISYTFGEVQGPYDCGHVEFVASVDGVGDPFSYKWFFSETDSLLTQNNEVNFIFPAFGIGTETFEVTLEVTDDNGCVVSQVENVTVNQRPDASLNEVSNPDQNPPGSTTLAYCDATSGNPEGFFELINASLTQGTNTWYEIIWGDGSADFEDDLFDEIVNHEYAEIGSYYLTFTVQGPTTCIGQTEYFVYVGAEPDGTLGQTGNLSGWVPFDMTFIIGETAGNPVGTEYYFDFGDGTDTIFYNVPPNGLLNYTYTTCPTEPSNLGVWGYIARLAINNACGDAGGTVHHVRVNCPAEAYFVIGDGIFWGGNGVDSLVTCTTVSFNNESTPGFFVTGGGSGAIDNVYYSKWNFGDPDSPTPISYEQNPTHTFTYPNQWYEVTLTTWTSNNPNAPPDNPLGYDVITRYIYAQGPPEPAFDMSPISDSCVPVTIQLTDTSMIPEGDPGIYIYTWEIELVEDDKEKEGEKHESNRLQEKDETVLKSSTKDDKDELEPIPLPFTEDFSNSPGDYWSVQGNWAFGTQHTPPSSSSGQPNAFFNWSPTQNNYSFSLTSPVFHPGPVSGTVMMDYLVFLNSYSSGTIEYLSVEYKAVDATNWIVLETMSNEDLGGGNEEFFRRFVTLDEITDQLFQVRFRAHGENSYNLNGWGVDDVVLHVNGDPNPTIVLEEAGHYQVRLGLTNACGTEYTDWLDIGAIVGPPRVEVLDTLSICGCDFIDITEENLVYDHAMGTISTYTWNVNHTGVEFLDNAIAYPTIEIIDDITQVYELTVTVNNECDETDSDPLLLMVTQTISGNSIGYLGESDYLICANTTLSDAIIGSIDPDLGGGTGEFEFEWYIMAGDGTEDDWIQIPDAEDSNLNYTEPITVHPTKFRRRVISGCCDSFSDPITINLTPAISGNSILSGPQVFCEGIVPDEIIASDPAGGNGVTYTFTWQQSVEPFTEWEAAAGTNDQKDYTPQELDETTHFRRLVESGACLDISDPVVIQVNANPMITNTQTALTICSGESTNFTLNFSINDSSFEWEINGDLDFISVEEDNSTASTLDHVLINTSNTNKEVTYTITPIGPPDTFCEGDDFELTVTVRPQFSHSYANKNIPTGTSTTLDGTLSGGTPGSPAYSYSWTPADKIQTGQSTLANPQTVILNETQQYTLLATDAAGCSIEINIEILTEGEEIEVSIEAEPSEIVCENSMITLTAIASGGGGNNPEDYTYSWTGLPAFHNFLDPPVNSIVEFVPLSIGENMYSVSAYYELPALAESDITITVNQAPAVESSTSHNTCSGTMVNYSPASSIINTVFAWTSETDSPFISGNTSGEGSINDMLVNSGSAIEYVTYTIIPTGPAPTFCEGDPFELTVAVNPVASVINTPSSQVVVSSQSSIPVNFSSDVNGVSYHWSSATSCPEEFVDYQYSGEVVGNSIPAQTINILPGGPETCNIIYTIIPVINGCEGNPFTHTIFVTMAPNTFVVSGGGTVCDGESTTVSLDGSESGISYQLLRNLEPIMSPQNGTGNELTWTGISQAGNYTVMGTNINSGVSEMMTGSADVVVNPLPYIFAISPQGDRCAPVVPKLSGSQAGVTYTLIRNGQFEMDVQIGTGNDEFLVFEQQSLPGDYTVFAVNNLTLCEKEMNGTLTIHPRPESFPIFPGGILCVGTSLFIEESQIGILYQLWHDDDPIGEFHQGTGGPIHFEPAPLPGRYRIFAKDPLWECDMFFEQEVWINPTPVQYALSPEICCPGCEITLSGWEPDTDYYLYFEDPSKTEKGIFYGPYTGDPAVNSNTLSFGQWSDEGTYSVMATNTYGCEIWMLNQTTIKAQPDLFSMTPSGAGCGPRQLGMDGSEPAAQYILLKDGEEIAQFQGTGEPLNMGTHEAIGKYTVVAVFNHHDDFSCQRIMKGSFEILNLPAAFNLVPATGIQCDCVNPHIVNSQPGIHYYLKNLTTGEETGPFTGDGNPIEFGEVCQAGQYKAYGVHPEYPSCVTWMTGAFEIKMPPLAYHMIPAGAGCPPDAYQLENSQPPATYFLYRDDEVVAEKQGTGSPLDFGTHTTPGTYTVKARMIHDNGQVCWNDMIGSYLAEPFPELFTLKPEQPACPGTSLYLSGSQTGVTYELHNDQSGLQQTKTGTGGAIYFDNPPSTQPGQYWVIAIKGNCEKQMNGTTTILPQPSAYEITPTGLYCTDDNLEIGLSGADPGFTYELHRLPFSGNPIATHVATTTGSFTFSGQYTIAGTYRVKAVNNQTNCQRWMNGQIVMNLPPFVYNMTVNGQPGDGMYCSPAVIGLEHSQQGTVYQLTKPDASIESIEGTGHAISFNDGNPFDEPGQYSIYAYNPSTTCDAHMQGSILLFETPVKYDLSSVPVTPWYCQGDEMAIQLRLNFSDLQVMYQLYKEDQTNPIMAPKPGTNNILTWDNVSQFGPGDYFVKAYFPNDPSCEIIMNNIVTIAEIEPPTASLSGVSEPMCYEGCAELEFNITGSLPVKIVYAANGIAQDAVFFDPGQPGPFTIEVCPDENTTYTILGIEYTELPYCEGVDISGSYTVEVQPWPVVDAGEDDVVCLAGTYQTNATAQHAQAFAWEIINGSGTLSQANALNTSYQPGAEDAGQYVELLLTAWGVAPCEHKTHTSTLTLFVQPLPEINMGATDHDIICESGSFLTSVNSEFASAYQWTVIQGNGHVAPDDQLNTTYFAAPGDGNTTVALQLKAHGEGACSTEFVTDIIEIMVDPLPIVDAGEGGTICENDTFQLAGSAEHFTITSVTWTITQGQGTFSDESILNPVFYPDPVDETTHVHLLLTVHGQGQCAQETISSEVVVVVQSLPQAFAGSNANICESGEYHIQDATASHFSTLHWEIIQGEGSFNDNRILSPVFYPQPVDQTENIILMLTVFGIGQCNNNIATSTMTIQVDPMPEAFAGNGGQTCVNTPYHLHDAMASHHDTVHWDVIIGMGIVSPTNAVNATYIPHPDDADTVVDLRLKVYGDGKCNLHIAFSRTTIHVHPLPQVSAGPDKISCVTNPVEITGAWAEHHLPESVSWTHHGSGNLISPQELNPIYQPGAEDAGNTITLTLTVAGQGECDQVVAKDTMFIQVEPIPWVNPGDNGHICASGSYTTNAEVQFASEHAWEIISGQGTLGSTNEVNTTYFAVPEDGGNTVILQLTLTGKGTCHQETVETTVEIIVDPLPIVNAGPGLNICEHESYQLAGYAEHFNISSITWTITQGQGTLSDATVLNPVFYPDPVDETTHVHLLLTVHGQGQCDHETISSEVVVVVHPLPQADTGPGGIICETGGFHLAAATVKHQLNHRWFIETGHGHFDDYLDLTPVFFPGPVDEPTEMVLRLEAYGTGVCTGQVGTSTVSVMVHPWPVANAGEGGASCVDTPFNLNDATTLYSSSVLWEVIIGHGTVSPTNALNADYIPAPGDAGKEVVLMLTAFGEEPCGAGSDFDHVTLYIENLPVANAGPDLYTCQTAPIQVTASSASHHASINWTHSGMGVLENPDELHPVYIPHPDETGATVSLTMVATGTGECSDKVATDMLLLHIEPVPVIHPGNNGLICANGSFHTGVAVDFASAYSWEIISGEGFIEPQNQINTTYHAVPEDGGSTVNLLLTATGQGSCHMESVSENIFLQVDPLPVADAGEDATMCENSQYQLQASAQNFLPESVSWTIIEGSGSISPESVLNPVFSPGEVDQVTFMRLELMVTGIGACTDTFTTSEVVIQVDPLPQAHAGSHGTVCETGAYILEDASALHHETVNWQVIQGSGHFENPQELHATFYPDPVDEPMEMILKLTAYAQGMCQGHTSTSTLSLQVMPKPVVEITESGVGCANTPFMVPPEASNAQYYDTVNWMVVFNEGYGLIENTGSFTPTYTPHPMDAGTSVLLELFAFGIQPCDEQVASDVFELKIGAPPIPWFKQLNDSDNLRACVFSEVNLQDLTNFFPFEPHPDQVISNRIWDFGDGTVIETNQLQVSHQYQEAGFYDITLTIETMIDGQLACVESVSREIQILKLPQADFIYAQVDFCKGKIQFEDRSIAYDTYIKEWLWYFGGGDFSKNPFPSYYYETSGNKSVTLTVTDQRGCVNDTTMVITVEEFFDFDLVFDDVCYTDTIEFAVDRESIKPPGNEILHYKWTFGDGSPPVFDPVAYHAYEHTGQYEVTLVAVDKTGCVKSKSEPVTVPEKLIPMFSFEDCDPFIVFYDESISYDTEIQSWNWDFGDGSNITLNSFDYEAIITHLYDDNDENTDYTVTLTVTDNLGCFEAYVAIVRTECIEFLTFFVPNAFAPEHLHDEINVFKPKGMNIEKYEMEVFDQWGNVLWKTTEIENGRPAEGWDGTYKNNPVPQGVYYWRAFVQFTDGSIWNNNNSEGARAGTITLIR